MFNEIAEQGLQHGAPCSWPKLVHKGQHISQTWCYFIYLVNLKWIRALFNRLNLTWDFVPLFIKMKLDTRESGFSGTGYLSVSRASFDLTERYHRNVSNKLPFFWICLFTTQARFHYNLARFFGQIFNGWMTKKG